MWLFLCNNSYLLVKTKIIGQLYFSENSNAFKKRTMNVCRGPKFFNPDPAATFGLILQSRRSQNVYLDPAWLTLQFSR